MPHRHSAALKARRHQQAVRLAFVEPSSSDSSLSLYVSKCIGDKCGDVTQPCSVEPVRASSLADVISRLATMQQQIDSITTKLAIFCPPEYLTAVK